MMEMMFEVAERVADAILYEGYVLYPYRASAAKNRFRWQLGVVAPPAPRDDGEPSFAETECLVEPARHDRAHRAAPRLSVRVRFLRPERTATGWLRGIPHAIDAVAAMELKCGAPAHVESLADGGVDVRLVVRAIAAAPFIKLQVRLESREPWRPEFDSNRDVMLERSVVGAHLLLALDGGSFVSMLEPPPCAAPFVDACRNRYTWPVLVGDRSHRAMMLSSPVVLYDYPSVAKESPGDLCDLSEIDEILSLRIMSMTDEEKDEARETDPRARAILDRVQSMTPGTLTSLHGTMRSADFFNPAGTPAPDEAHVVVANRRVARGSKVRLRPNCRDDSMDMFLSDQLATVSGVFRDVDDRTYVAVTIDIDPAASLHESFGRFFYFDPSEVEPIDPEQERR